MKIPEIKIKIKKGEAVYQPQPPQPHPPQQPPQPPLIRIRIVAVVRQAKKLEYHCHPPAISYYV
jgi:hypothetical protein